jgi:hypothetical protein
VLWLSLKALLSWIQVLVSETKLPSIIWRQSLADYEETCTVSGPISSAVTKVDFGFLF